MIRPNSNQTLLDIALMTAGTPEGLFDFGINPTADLPQQVPDVDHPVKNERVLVVYRAEKIKPSTKRTASNAPASVTYSRTYKYVQDRTDLVLNGQTLLDIALMMSGSVESVFEVAFKNELNVSSTLVPGTKIINPDQVLNRDNYDYYVRHRVKPVTGIAGSQPTSGGIGYWGIEVDFIVQ